MAYVLRRRRNLYKVGFFSICVHLRPSGVWRVLAAKTGVEGGWLQKFSYKEEIHRWRTSVVRDSP